MKEYNRKYYEKNKQRLLPIIRARVRKWQRENSDKRNQKAKDRVANGTSKNAVYNKRARLKLKLIVLAAYGNTCECCGESEPECLTLDHRYGGGSTERKSKVIGGGDSWRTARKEGFPYRFRLLCFNCNYSTYLGNGVCIHKRKGPQ